MNPLFHTDFSISDSLKNFRKSVLIYETIILYGTLNELENELKDFHFIRIHQSYLTNLKYIRSVKCYKVLLCNNQELLIPKARYKNVKDAFISYKGEL